MAISPPSQHHGEARDQKLTTDEPASHHRIGAIDIPCPAAGLLPGLGDGLGLGR